MDQQIPTPSIHDDLPKFVNALSDFVSNLADFGPDRGSTLSDSDSALDDAFPCWPCLRRKLKEIDDHIWTGFGRDSPPLLESCCEWESATKPKCDFCYDHRLVCCSVPGLLEGNVKDVLQTLSYADMLARVEIANPLIFNLAADTHLLPVQTREDLIAAATMVGSAFIDIVDEHKEHQKSIRSVVEYEELVQKRRAEAVSAF